MEITAIDKVEYLLQHQYYISRLYTFDLIPSIPSESDCCNES